MPQGTQYRKPLPNIPIALPAVSIEIVKMFLFLSSI